MAKIFMVITNSGDGSNGIQWVKDPTVIAKMQALADEGHEMYASGDGLQATELDFSSATNIEEWAARNTIEWTTLEEVNETIY